MTGCLKGERKFHNSIFKNILTIILGWHIKHFRSYEQTSWQGDSAFLSKMLWRGLQAVRLSVCLSAAQSTKLQLLITDSVCTPAINELSNPGAIGQHSFWITLHMLVSCWVYKVTDFCSALWGKNRWHHKGPQMFGYGLKLILLFSSWLIQMSSSNNRGKQKHIY